MYALPTARTRCRNWVNTEMGKLALAAKITHVPSMYLSEQDGPHKGCREAAIEGHYEIARRCRDLEVDTIVVFDVHWLVNSAYHINCAASFEGIYTSNELPHFIKNMEYRYDGNTQLGNMIAERAQQMNIRALAHSNTSLGLEYGTLLPMRYMNDDRRFRVISIAGWCSSHELEDSATLGRAAADAVREDYDGNVAILASGSLSHRFADSRVAEQYLHKVWSPFYEQFDRQVVSLWQKGDWKTFIELLPEYAEKCHGEGGMHDTAMLLGALGWDGYQGKAEIITPYFGSSGTGQINAVLPIE